MVSLLEFFRMFRKLDEHEQSILANVEETIDKKELNFLTKLVKIKKVNPNMSNLDFGYKKISYPNFDLNSKNEDETKFIENINKKIWNQNKETIYRDFSKNAYDIIPSYIAPNIIGLDAIKQSGTLQLFSNEAIHILLLGDPGTGKTDILRSLKDLSPISSLGLGSGTSGAGLAITVHGDNILKGLLPMANGGICCIDELNLMDKKDSASLYNAMEKGFVSYDKGGKHIKFDAKIKVIATANPKGDQFDGVQLNQLKKQMPFDSALMSRFHLVFIVIKPDAEKFEQISKRIIKGVKTKISKEIINFVNDYVKKTLEIDPTISKEIEAEMNEFLSWLKKSEKNYIIEISPRTVIGFMRLAKASARMELRQKVEKKDIKRVKQLYLDSLKMN